MACVAAILLDELVKILRRHLIVVEQSGLQVRSDVGVVRNTEHRVAFDLTLHGECPIQILRRAHGFLPLPPIHG